VDREDPLSPALTPLTVAARFAAAASLLACATACGLPFGDPSGPASSSAPVASPEQVTGPGGAGASGTDRSGGGVVGVDAAVGDCLEVGGTEASAEAEKKDCADPAAGHRVASTAADENSCPADSDSVYYETRGSTTRGALCLDRNWRVGQCYLQDPSSKRYTDVECTRQGALRYVTTVPDAVSPDACPDPADTGVPYPDRRFVACFEEITTA